ncbi:MAG: hypothetical protein ABI740_06115, partial [Alphaproteobacteria bacterium]
ITKETGIERPPVIEVWNKADELDPTTRTVLAARAAAHSPPAILSSALTGEGADQLLFAVEAHLFRDRIRRLVTLPASDGRARAWLHKNCEVANEEMAGDAELRVEVYVARLHAIAPLARVGS